jgi:Ethanolamine utilization protein EutJ (predicted chaperonin)
MTGPDRPQTMQTSQPPFTTSASRGVTIAVVASAPIDVVATVDKSIRACEP